MRWYSEAGLEAAFRLKIAGKCNGFIHAGSN
jgi:hypothetical protein